jgi:hypothetical protein
MKVLPFFLKHKTKSLAITNFTVFLSHSGKSVWQTDESSVTEKQLQEEYLQPNGFVDTNIHFTPQIVYVEIDPFKTPLHDFYTWEEANQLQKKVECWRSYYFFKDATGADWFSGKQLQESELEGKPIHEYYEDILRHFA